jgi:hypothetical protein
MWRMSLQVFCFNTELLQFPDTFLKIGTLEWREGLNMRPIQKQKLSRFIVQYMLRALSFFVGRQGSRLSEYGGDVSRGGFLRAWGRKNTVDCGCVAKFSDQVRKGPPGEENKQWYKEIPTWRGLVHRKTPRMVRPFGGKSEVREVGFQLSPHKPANSARLELGIQQPTLWRILRKRLKVNPYN